METTMGASSLTKSNFAEKAKQEIAKAGYLLVENPFIVGVESGRLSLEQIQHWARQNFVMQTSLHRLAHSRPRPSESGLSDPFFKKMFWENRIEEEYGAVSGTAGHLELFLRFAVSIGLSRMDMAVSKPTPPIKELLGWLKEIFKNESLVVSQLAIGFVEEQVPAAFSAIARGLKQHYKLTDADVLFFTLHVTADEEHGDVAERLIELLDDDALEHAKDIVVRQCHFWKQLYLAYN